MVEDVPRIKSNLFEYVLRWVVDPNGNFIRWEQSQLLADYKIFGVNILNMKPFIPTSDRIEGIMITTNNKGSFIINNSKDLDYEFQDDTF